MIHSEMACDELVIATGANRRDYANTILNLAKTNTDLRNGVAGL